MTDTIPARIDAWLSRCPDPASDPFPGMQEAGLFEPLDRYSEIARIKGALVQRTGLIGVAGAWGGRHLVGRWFIDGFATPAQRETWRGRPIAVGISEPGVGAHPKHLRTRAVREGSVVRITGEKAWVSNGPSSDAIIVLAVTDETPDGRKRYSAFLVPRDADGVMIKDMPGFHALRPSRHCGLVLQDVQVPADNQLGPDGSAYDRMALPFRDVEDAVGTFALLGAFRFLLQRFAAVQGRDEDAIASLGALAALAAVFLASAEAVVTALDAGQLAGQADTLVGLRVLAADMLERARAHFVHHVPAGDAAVATMLDDIKASLSVARGPRMARQARLGVALLPPE